LPCTTLLPTCLRLLIASPCCKVALHVFPWSTQRWETLQLRLLGRLPGKAHSKYTLSYLYRNESSACCHLHVPQLRRYDSGEERCIACKYFFLSIFILGILVIILCFSVNSEWNWAPVESSEVESGVWFEALVYNFFNRTENLKVP